MSEATFILKKSFNGWKWVLTHNNGTVLAEAAQNYTRKSDVKRAISRFQRVVPSATLRETSR